MHKTFIFYFSEIRFPWPNFGDYQNQIDQILEEANKWEEELEKEQSSKYEYVVRLMKNLGRKIFINNL